MHSFNIKDITLIEDVCLELVLENASVKKPKKRKKPELGAD